MRQAKVAGLDVAGTKYMHGYAPVEGNPGGYYDLIDPEVVVLTSGVGKVWPRQIPLLRVVPDKIVALRRGDTAEWHESIKRQMKRERSSLPYTIDELLRQQEEALDFYLNDFPGEIMQVYTEDLNDQILNIIKFIGD